MLTPDQSLDLPSAGNSASSVEDGVRGSDDKASRLRTGLSLTIV